MAAAFACSCRYHGWRGENERLTVTDCHRDRAENAAQAATEGMVAANERPQQQ